jgi:predicted nucleic acid-binding protein
MKAFFDTSVLVAAILSGHSRHSVCLPLPKAFEVEFVDTQGHTYALQTLSASQLIQLHHQSLVATA